MTELSGITGYRHCVLAYVYCSNKDELKLEFLAVKQRKTTLHNTQLDIVVGSINGKLIKLVLTKPLAINVIFGIKLHIIKCALELGKITNLYTVRTFYLVHVCENVEGVANGDLFAKFFAHFAFQARDDVFAKVYVAAREFIYPWKKLFSLGPLR